MALTLLTIRHTHDIIISPQAAVFEKSGAVKLVDSAMQGLKATILAYGATSSGKTYTMSGLDQSSHGEDAASVSRPEPHDVGAHAGIIPRAAAYLWRKILQAEQSEGCRYTITASYCEVYNEQVWDTSQAEMQANFICEQNSNFYLGQLFFGSFLTRFTSSCHTLSFAVHCAQIIDLGVRFTQSDG